LKLNLIDALRSTRQLRHIEGNVQDSSAKDWM